MPKKNNDSDTFKEGRSGETGRFMPAEEAKGKPNAIVQTMKKNRGGGRKSSKPAEPATQPETEAQTEAQTEPEPATQTEPAQTNYPNAEVEETNRRLTSPPRTSPEIFQTEANAELAQIKQTGSLAKIAENMPIKAGASEADLRK